MKIRLALVLLPLAACASSPSSDRLPPTWNRYERPIHSQGMIGITELEGLELGNDGTLTDELGRETLPALGGAWQLPLAGDTFQMGLESGFTFGFEGNRTVRTTSGGGTVTRDNDLLILDFFVGAFAATRLGQDTRLYVAGGPLMQYGRLSTENVDENDEIVQVRDSSFEGGTYVRAGIEQRLRHDLFLGVGVRWIDSSLDFSTDAEPIEFDGFQYLLTVSTGF